MAGPSDKLKQQAADLGREVATTGSVEIDKKLAPAAKLLVAQGLISVTDGQATPTPAGQFAFSSAMETPAAAHDTDAVAIPPTIPIAIEQLKETDRKRRKAPPVKETDADRQISNNLYQGNAEELLQFVERIEQFESEKKDIAAQVKEVFAELKGRGFDAKAIRKVVALRKIDPQVRQEQDAILETYLAALGMI